MSTNLGYTRKFIILKKDYCNIPGLNPKGHGKLEVKGLKGSISISLENVESNNVYSLLLIYGRKNYELGKIYTEEKGKGKGDFTFSLKDLEGTGFSIDRINGILITRDSQVLLGGYLGKEDNSLDEYINSMAMTVKEVDPQPVYEEIIHEEEVIEEIVIPQDIVDEVIIPQDIIIPQDVKEEILIEEIIEEVAIEEVVIDEVVIEDNEEPFIWEIFQPSTDEVILEDSETEIVIPLDLPNEEFPLNVESSTVSDNKVRDGDSNNFEIDYENLDNQRRINQRNQTTNYVLNILRFFPYIDPFKYNLSGYNWWKIDLEDSYEQRGFLPYFSYIIGGNHKYPVIGNAVTANELMRKYEHYLFGIYNSNDEVKFYVYGIPGKFIKEEHPQRGATGFNTWYKSYDDENEGYWILFIDSLTGKVIYPINPMIPVD